MRHMKPKLLYTLQSTLGIAVSAVCAIAVALIFSRTQWKLAAPFLFAAVLVLLASRFGAMVSVVGSLLAALIFSVSAVSSRAFTARSERNRAGQLGVDDFALGFGFLPSVSIANRPARSLNQRARRITSGAQTSIFCEREK